MIILTLEKIHKTIVDDQEKIKVLRDISLALEEGSLTTLIGPSGCGKSTLLRIIAGLIQPSSGQIIWKDNTPPTLSFVFQNFGLFPYLTVSQNIEFGLKMTGIDKKIRQKTVTQLIQEMGLTGFENKHPSELSGGMKQRVGIARALAMEPQILLLDEPFSSLDEFTAENLRALLLKIWQDRKITILMVTHLISEAIELSDQIVAMTPRPGTIEKIIQNDLPRPRNKRSDTFFKLEDTLQNILKV